MAERRMFAKTIVDSDAFLDMPLSSQALYFHLAMRADDDGFVNNPKKIQRMIGATSDDLKLLLAKNFVIAFESGIVVIKHWKIHNYIQKDRYKPTVYTEEKALLSTKDNNGYRLESECIHSVSKLDTQVRLGKVRLGKSKESTIYVAQNGDASDPIPYAEIVNYLNEKTGKSYGHKTVKTRKNIHARFAEGYGIDDFKKVIDKKVKEWLADEKMKNYLRPDTLFSTKFEWYLNQDSDELEF
jgi:uncharacterized phage protein (TIGR02220 family)